MTKEKSNKSTTVRYNIIECNNAIACLYRAGSGPVGGLKIKKVS